MIDARNSVRGRPEQPGSKTVWAPARFGGTGPCFAARETSGMLQMISRLGNAWPSRPGAANVVSDVQNALPLWHMERRRTFDPVRSGSLLLVRRSHDYP